ncbi:HigA family addiction module antitoxin [Thalassospira sp.]|uniref:HigA family addiction module antitoxin n=1 Tax=Thalassospira sp. TaxID=1912094 RepID=UPI001B217EAA|nr:HigA family addiction module antitoxin [Thalassospira sp.]MBO6807872.1 HigA family addiction module antidote protein [Thalassospira sp.]MBO6840918.1 HigA family addiction module antidote protein [Thalassospira sp.]
MINTARKPVNVGEMLVTELMEPMALTQTALAEAMGVKRNHLNGLCNNRLRITADTVLTLAHVFGNSTEFWINLQARNDIGTSQFS